MEVEAACPRCGTDRSIAVRRVPDFSGHLAGAWDFARCEPCDAWWMLGQPPGVPAELVPESYPTHTEPHDVLGESGDGPAGVRVALKWAVLRHQWGYVGGPRSAVADLIARWLVRAPGVSRRAGLNSVFLLPGPPGRLLDVGCGNGAFLLTMRRLGWQGQGLEPDPAAAAMARRRGIDVAVARVEETDLPEEAFDAVTMSHALEHVADPWRVLERITRAVRAGGQVRIAVPNPGGAAARYFGADWRAWDPPRHLVLLGPRGLLQAARAAGLVARVIATHRLDRGTVFASLHHRTGRAPGRLAMARHLVRLRASPHGGDELVLAGSRPARTATLPEG